MKELLLLVTIGLTLIFCSSESTDTDLKNLSNVNLNLEDYDPGIHKSFINLKIENGITPIEEQLKISEDGIINYTFINSRVRELIFNYENRQFSLIISPGEDINVTLTVAQLLDWASKFVGFEVLSGVNIETNNLILTNTPFLDSLIETASSPFQRDVFESDLQYKEKRILEMKNHLNKFDEYCKIKNINDQNFCNWSIAQIKYSAGKDLSVFPFMGVFNRKIADDSEYFNFIKIIDSVNEDNLRYHVYLDYMEGLATSFEIIANISDKYSSEREILKEKSSSSFPILLEILRKSATALNDQTIIASAFHHSSGITEKYRDSIRHLVTDKSLLAEQTNYDHISSNLILILKEYDIPENEKQQLIDIYEGFKGKVVFHDFWFESCSPCMKELPNYNDLMEYSKVENVEFLFYGAYMEEKDWKRVIQELGIDGRHHLLTKNQIAFFEKYFGLLGFPHHHLLKDNGEIGEKVGLRVDPDNFERIDSIIQRHRGT